MSHLLLFALFIFSYNNSLLVTNSTLNSTPLFFLLFFGLLIIILFHTLSCLFFFFLYIHWTTKKHFICLFQQKSFWLAPLCFNNLKYKRFQSWVHTRPVLLSEDDLIRNVHQRLQTIRREFPREHVWIRVIRLPELVNELRWDLIRVIGMRVPVHTTGPIDPSECVMGTPIRILHWQKGREVMLFRVTWVFVQTRQFELPP